jgi:hypothetical protein
MKLSEDDFRSRFIFPGRRDFARQLLVAGMSALAGGTLFAQLCCSSARKASREIGEGEMTLKPLKGVMKDTLKERIAADDPTNFRDGNWDKIRFGLYYDEDDELVNIVVYETAAFVASSREKTGRYLPDDVWRNLIARVGPNHTPEEALDPMVDAVMRSLPLPEGDEGPIINGPRKRPTLRSARKTTNG